MYFVRRKMPDLNHTNILYICDTLALYRQKFTSLTLKKQSKNLYLKMEL